jgi:hypothetical protein
MKRLLLLFAMALIFGQAAQAQANYGAGIGLRLGPTYGLTYKQFMSPKAAFELILQSRYYGGNYSRHGWNRGASGFNFVALYEHHGAVKGLNGLNWFLGIGGHLGYWRGYTGHRWFPEDRAYFALGVDAIVGLEYTFKEAPFTIGVDWKPAFNLIGWSGFWGDEGAFTIRYNFR